MSFMNLSREQQNELLFVGFNQDSGALLTVCEKEKKQEE